MKLLFLLAVAIVLTTQVFACNYDRMSRTPDYAKLTTPRKVLNVPNPHGICIAPKGNFAVTSWNADSKIYLYYACGKLMKVVDLRKHASGYKYSGDCAFTESNLYITSSSTNQVYELSSNGEFIRVFASGHSFFHIAICQNRFYFTSGPANANFLIYDNNGKLLRSHKIERHSRGVVVGTDDKVYVSSWDKKIVYSFTLDGVKLGTFITKEVNIADSLAMDNAGHLLVTDHKSSVAVYSPCGAVVKTINTGGNGLTCDVEIGNDGTVLVAAYRSSKIYMY